MRKELVIGVATVIILGAGLWYWYASRGSETGAVGTAKALSEAVPEIQANLGENVSEINPLDLANPFKYVNPLR